MDIVRIDPTPKAVDPISTVEGDATGRPALQTATNAPPMPPTRPEPSAQTRAQASDQPNDIEKIVSEINKKLQAGNHQVRFEMDKNTKQVIFRLIDSDSGEVLRQIPPDDVLRMAEQMARDSDTHFIQTTA